MVNEREEAFKLAQEAGFDWPAGFPWELTSEAFVKLICLARQSAPQGEPVEAGFIIDRCRALQELAEWANGGWDIPSAGTKAISDLVRKLADYIEALESKVRERIYPPAAPDVVRDAQRYRWILEDPDRRWWTLWGFSRKHNLDDCVTSNDLNIAIDAALQT